MERSTDVVEDGIQYKLNSAFMKPYVDWYENFYGKPFQFPVFNKRFFNVEKLWYEVEAQGGSAQVCLSKSWAEIGRKFDPPQYVTNLSTIIKGIYERYLLEYEQRLSPLTAMPTSSTRSTRKRRNPNSRTSSQNKQLRLHDGPANLDSPRIENLALKEEIDDDYDGGASTPPDPLSPSSEDAMGGAILDVHILRNEIESQKNKLEMVVAFIDQMKAEQQNKINAVQTYNDMVLQALAKRISSLEEQLQAVQDENQALRDKLQNIFPNMPSKSEKEQEM
eukprot:TRINITY_DN2845_c0_g1_i1.p2 TRINITY_DN2845_c0_g1~~TRINITY_DN2845_c0_g1_i1.p2  ORF type:complete len:278 (-),score=32.39 TRINITY_DN2845_c0_g1_i1:286-1119(-)